MYKLLILRLIIQRITQANNINIKLLLQLNLKTSQKLSTVIFLHLKQTERMILSCIGAIYKQVTLFHEHTR